MTTDEPPRRIIDPDAIPSIDNPVFAPTYDGTPEDQMIVVDPNRLPGLPSRPPRAYPVAYLDFHEIVNDTFADIPVAVTWCPLCGSAAVYDRREAVNGEPLALEFGVSGKLAADNLVLYDRETDSEWKQTTGECLSGPLQGHSLARLSGSVMSFNAFETAYPDGVILQPPGGRSEAAGVGDEPEPIDYSTEPYGDYAETDGFGLSAHRGTGSREWRIESVAPKDPVFGIEVADIPVGFPVAAVARQGGVVTTTVGDQSVVVFETDTGVRAFDNPGFQWRKTAAGFRAASVDDGSADDQTPSGALYDGATGEPVDAPAAHTGEAGGAAAEPLEPIPGVHSFAFAWIDDYGRDSMHETI